MDFAVARVNSVLNLPEGQVIFLAGIQFCSSIFLFFGQVEVSFGLVHTTILDKIDGKFVPPSLPNQGWENGCSILFCPRL